MVNKIISMVLQVMAMIFVVLMNLRISNINGTIVDPQKKLNPKTLTKVMRGIGVP